MLETISWHDLLAEEKQKPYFSNILKMIVSRRKMGINIYPAQKDIFNAFRLTQLADIKVVILGQDPYHGARQAHGLAFSVLPGMSVPPSLKNIYRELEVDIPGFIPPNHGSLESWARQGVFLLNSVLTVEEGKANSHANLGWETFTSTVLALINHYCEGVIFLLWGSYAKKRAEVIDRECHHILSAPHPSPLSARYGFFGCKHFSSVNSLLKGGNQEPINWHLPNL